MQPATNEILLKLDNKSSTSIVVDIAPYIFQNEQIFNQGHVNFKLLGNNDTSITLATIPATTRQLYTEDYTAKLFMELTIIFSSNISTYHSFVDLLDVHVL